MAKQPATIYVCQNCGGQSRKWLGQCPDCQEWNTLVEERFRPMPQAAGKAARSRYGVEQQQAVQFTDIESQDDARTSSGIEELDRVLGGGIVAGSLVLIGGSPGIGKSTIVIQMADKLSQNGSKVLYVSGEESERQIKMRGERLGLSAGNLFLLPETNLQSILAVIEKLRPDFIIVDSIQTVFSEAIESAPGSVSQVRDVAGQFMMLAKQTATPVFLTGHVTKEGSIAGVGARFRTSRGLDPHGFRLLADVRAEGAAGAFDYSRGAFDATISHGIGPRLDGSLTLSGGTSGGRVPAQRHWYLGGAQTIRGHDVGVASGNAFWMGRAELGTSFIAARPVIFYDLGWAGSRTDWQHPGVPVSGAGIGASFVDGLFRFDLAKGIRPNTGVRAYFYLEAKF